MKKILLGIGLSLGLIQIAQAAPIGFGVKAGPNWATEVYQSTGSPFTEDILLAFNAGVFVEFGLNDFLSLQPEADFTIKGNQDHINNIGTPSGTANATFSNSFDYFEIPLLLKAQISLLPQFAGQLFVGPYGALLLSANDHVSYQGGTAPSASGNFNIANEVSSTDWGLVFGGGLKCENYLLNVRYELGLDNFDTNVHQNGPVNSVLSIQVGYQFL
jgi:hypothetical protein